MEKNKNILIITSGAFLCVLAIMVFVTFKARDNMIGSAGRTGSYNELQLGDTNCTNWVSSGTTYVLDGTISACNGVPTRANASATAEEACELEGYMAPTAYACSDSDSDEEICAIISRYTRTCTTTQSCLSGEFWDSSSQNCRRCDSLTPSFYGSSAAGSVGSSSCYATIGAQYEIVTAGAQMSQCASGYVQQRTRVYYNSAARCTKCGDDETPDYNTRQCVPNGSSGVVCSAKQYLPANSSTCEPCTVNHYCPGGTFTTGSSNQGISSCPSGKYSTSGGAASESDCKEVPISCLSGEFYDTSLGICKRCDSLTPSFYGASQPGSVGSSSCYVAIGAQYEIVTVGAQMSQCASDSVQQATNAYYGSTAKCTKCGANQTPNYSTRQCVTNGGTSTCTASHCSTCQSGSTTLCSVCEYGYYNDNGTCREVSQPCCISGSTSTSIDACKSAASTSPSTFSAGSCPTSSNVDCCYYAGGQYIYTSVPKTTCDDAYGGTQKSQSACEAQNTTTTCNVKNCKTCVSGNANRCSVCNTGYHIVGSGCVADTDCSSAGEYKTSAGTCKTCEKGYYCPDNDEDRYACDLGETTSGTGSTDEEDCNICKDGFTKANDGSCVEDEQQVAYLICYTKQYDGNKKTVAFCKNCTIQSGSNFAVENNGSFATATGNANQDTTYSVTAVADAGKVFSGSTSCTATILKENSSLTTDNCCYMDGSTYKYGSTVSTNCVTDTELIHNETKCLNKNKKYCCYKVGSTYKYDFTTAENCDTSTGISLSDTINVNDRATCTAKNSNCTATVSTISQITSRPEDGTDNSHYEVSVTLTGDGCLGMLVYDKATNKKSISPTQFTAPDAGTYHFDVYPQDSCQPSYAWVELANGYVSNQTSSVTIKEDWHSVTICETNPNPGWTTFESADQHGADTYYSNWGTCADGVTQGFTKKWTRTADCGGGTTPTPTPSDPVACYFKLGSNGSPNSYCYNTQSACAGYTQKLSGKDATTCNEDPKCYQKTDGTYVKGKYSGQTGYKLIGDNCPTPTTENPVCYVKRGSNGTQNDYCYGTSSSCPGYTQTVYGKDRTNCDEPEACYRKSDGTYVKGKYDGQTGYQYYGSTCPKADPACYEKPNGDRYWTSTPSDDDVEITSITDQASCENPDSGEKCYKDSSGGYHWAKTPGDASWVEQPGITKASDCTDNEDPACYKKTSTGEYSWGKYGKVIGWEPVASITEQNKCVRPEPACYMDSFGDYHWGNYEGQNSYTKVNKTEQECKSAIPVPPTAFDRYKVIYIAVCTFALAGIGMVMYVKKRKEMNKN